MTGSGKPGPVEYKISWPKAGKVSLSFPIGDGWRLYLYRVSHRGRTWYEVKRSKPLDRARWMSWQGEDSVFANYAINTEKLLFAGLETWLLDTIEPLRLTLLLQDMREVWAYAEQDMAYRHARPPVTAYLVPDFTARTMANRP